MQALQALRNLTFSEPRRKELSLPQRDVFRPFSVLPPDVQRQIFSYLDIRSLIKCLSLDKTTREILDSLDFWNQLIYRDQESWKAYGNNAFIQRVVTSPFMQLKARLMRKVDGVTPVEKQRQFYLQHELEVLPPDTSKLFTINDLRTGPPVVPMFGEAGSGYGFAKKLLYNMMWTDNASIQLTTLIPGKQGVGSGVAFKIEGRVMALSAVSKTTERNIFECMQEPGPWRDFYHDAGGAVMVINASIELENSAQELRAHLAHLPPTAPLLVLAVDPGTGGPVKTPFQVAEALRLGELTERSWRVRGCSMRSMDGLYEGLVWLKRSFLF
jgi:hypothetical protein